MCVFVCVCLAGMFGRHLQSPGILAKVGTHAHRQPQKDRRRIHPRTWTLHTLHPRSCGLLKFGCQHVCTKWTIIILNAKDQNPISGESRRTKPPGNSFFLSLTLSHTHTHSHTCPGILRNVISLQAISYIGQHTSTRCCIIHIFYDSCDQLKEMYKTWNINVRDVNEGWCCQGDKKVHYERFSDLAEINSSMPVPLFESPD